MFLLDPWGFSNTIKSMSMHFVFYAENKQTNRQKNYKNKSKIQQQKTVKGKKQKNSVVLFAKFPNPIEAKS